jgi:cytochrome c peroxidase
MSGFSFLELWIEKIYRRKMLRVAARFARSAAVTLPRASRVSVFSTGATNAPLSGRVAALSAGLAFSGVAFGSVLLLQTPVQAAEVDLPAVKSAIVKLIESDDEKRGDGTSIGGTFVRLAWHCAGTFSGADNSGGSDGARMRFSPEATWGANAGLTMARDALEPIKRLFSAISYSDLYTLSGAVAVEHMGGPAIPFKLGRKDAADGASSPPDGRLPGADCGCQQATIAHIREIFGRMGFSDKEMVALIGAHAIGRCHTDASGYWGPWTNAETTFSNEYFRLLVEEKWTVKKTHGGKKWTGPQQYEDPSGQLMMLPADLALVWDPQFKTIVESYAKDEAAFFKDFASVFGKLLALGCPAANPNAGWKAWAKSMFCPVA